MVLVFGGLFILMSSAYTVDEVEQVIITQFGKPVGEPVTEAGLKFKVPFVQEVNPIDKRERVVAGWSDIGLWTDSGIFDLPLTAPGLGGWVQEIDCYDRQWNPLMDLAARCRAERTALEQMAIECVRFLDVPK